MIRTNLLRKCKMTWCDENGAHECAVGDDSDGAERNLAIVRVQLTSQQEQKQNIMAAADNGIARARLQEERKNWRKERPFVR